MIISGYLVFSSKNSYKYAEIKGGPSNVICKIGNAAIFPGYIAPLSTFCFIKSAIKLFYQKCNKICNASNSKHMRAGLRTVISILCGLKNYPGRVES